MKKQIVLDVIKQLGYDFDHFDLHHFIEHIEKVRGRDIILSAAKFEHELSALWIPAETADYIFYNMSHHSIHQTHSILHELAHITLNHSCKSVRDILPEELLAEFDNSDVIGRPRIVDPMFQASPEEQEAEEFVYIIQRKVMNADRMQHLLGQGSSISSLNEYIEGMGFDV